MDPPLALRGRHSSTTIRNVRKHGTDVAWHKNTICGRRRSEVAHYRTRRYSRWSAWIRAASSPSRNSLAPREVTDVHLSVNARSVRHAVTAAAGRRARAESSRAARRRRDGALMRFVAPITARSPSSGARSLSLARPVIILSGSCSRRLNNATEYRDSAAEREREAFYTPCARRRRSADESPAYTETERRCGGHNVSRTAGLGRRTFPILRQTASWMSDLRLSRPLSVSQHGQLSHPSLRGR